MRSKSDKAQAFLYYLRLFAMTAPEPQPEYRFHAERKWRFDWAWPEQRVAVEVNGEAWNTKGGGRHGKAADLEKLNAAQAAGWRVFQYTPAMLDLEPITCVSQVLAAVNGERE